MTASRRGDCVARRAPFSSTEPAGAAATGEVQTSARGTEEVTQAALGVARDAGEAAAFVARAPRSPLEHLHNGLYRRPTLGRSQRARCRPRQRVERGFSCSAAVTPRPPSPTAL